MSHYPFKQRPLAAGRERHRGFSLTEILVVLTVLVILIAISVPAFRTLMNNSERTLAENQLRVGLSAGRDAAIRSDSGDGAAVFYFEEGRMRIVPCVSVGMTPVADGAAPGGYRYLELFAPLSLIEPVALPRGWTVRGYATPGTISGNGDAIRWYEGFVGLLGEGNWLLPETHFVSFEGAGVESRGVQRHSFMVRFKNATGTLDTSNRAMALVMDLVPEDGFRGSGPFNQARADQAGDLVNFARRTLGRYGAPADRPTLSDLLGDRSIDTVLVRPVTEVALCDEVRLLTGIGARPNRVTGTLYLPPNPALTYATFDPAGLPAGTSAEEAQERINDWVQGQLVLAGSGNAGASDARVFMLQRYLGQVQEILP